MIGRPFVILCTAILLAAMAAFGGAADRIDGRDSYIAVSLAQWEVPGIAVAVVRDGEVVLMKTYGVVEAGTDHPIDENTLFPIASCTKSFTAASLAILVDEGRLQWDDPVVMHLSEFKVADPQASRQLTLRDLLCHRTGLQSADLLLIRGDVTRAEVLQRARVLQQQSPIRTKDSYNNLMYVVLGEVVSRASGRPWEEFVTERLFEPLKMTSTTFHPYGAENVAIRHWQHDGRVIPRSVRPHIVADAAAAGIYSSIRDMAHWARFQLGDGRFEGQKILTLSSLREMQAMHTAIPIRTRDVRNRYAPRFRGAGLGWYTWDYRGQRLVVQNGSWGSVVALLPEQRLGVVVLSNLDWNGLAGMLMYRLLDAYTQQPEVVWNTANFSEFLSADGAHGYQRRDREKRQLELERTTGTQPSLPLEAFAGMYSSSLFGELQIGHGEDGGLVLELGAFTCPLEHWHRNSFYAHAPTEMNFDWLLEFDVARERVKKVIVRYVGWQLPHVVFERGID